METVTFLVPIELTSVSRNVPGDHYSRKVANVCLPAWADLPSQARCFTPASRMVLEAIRLTVSGCNLRVGNW